MVHFFFHIFSCLFFFSFFCCFVSPLDNRLFILQSFKPNFFAGFLFCDDFFFRLNVPFCSTSFPSSSSSFPSHYFLLSSLLLYLISHLFTLVLLLFVSWFFLSFFLLFRSYCLQQRFSVSLLKLIKKKI